MPKRKLSFIPFVIAAVLVVLLFAGVKYFTDHVRYRGYSVVNEKDRSDNGISRYLLIGDRILRYASDGVSLLDQSLVTVWNISLDYTAPQAEVCSGCVVVYDRQGTDIAVFDEKGRIGSFKTQYPILKASVSKKGNVAVIEDHTNFAMVKYYSSDGTLIADVAGGEEELGYPVDAAVSEDGLTLIVSYLKPAEDGVSTEIAVYSFNRSANSSGENLIYSKSLYGTVCPDVLTGGSYAVALTENGFLSYEIGSGVKGAASVSFDEEILSAFYDSEYIGFLYKATTGNTRYGIRLYRLNGKKSCEVGTDLLYETVCVQDGSIVLANDSELEIISAKGVRRFLDVVEDNGIYSVLKINRTRYLLSTAKKTKILEIKLLDTAKTE